jgi:RNA polymerase sigma-70 factor (sigma-E family)
MDWFGGSSARRVFEHFVGESTSDLLRTAYLLTWNLAEAEDLLQEAFLRTARRWPAIKKMDHPHAYVRRIVVNLALAGAERRSRFAVELDARHDEHLELYSDPRPEEALGAIDTRSELLRMVATLPRRQRAVLVLRYFEDLSEAEIANCLGWPIGTVKSTAARALDRLQQSAEALRSSEAANRFEPVPRSKGNLDVRSN